MSIISRSERSKSLEINSLEVKPKKTINPLVARALSKANQLKLRPDINALKKRIAISNIKENESCFFSGYSGVKNEMIDFFYCLSGWLSEKSNDLNEVIKFQVNAIYECVKFNKITQDEKINSFFFSLKYLDGKDFKLIWESKLEIDQKEIKLFDVVFSKQEEKDAILMELAERNKLTLIELCSVFLFFKNSYNFRSRSELLKSEIFDAMNLALKKENINFLAIICNSELTQFNLKLNFLNWLYNRKSVTDMEKYFSNWKFFKAKVLDDLSDIIKFKNNDLSIWLFKKYYEEESEIGRNYLSAELINAGSEFIYTAEVCSMLQYNIISNFRTIFKLSCYFEKFNIVDNLIKIDCENYLQVNFHYCCVEIIKNDRKFEFEKLKLIKELLKLKNLDLDVYELSNLIEMCLIKSHKTIFKLFMDEFSSYKKDVLKIIFTKTELFKIDIVTANLILYLDKEELNKNRIFTFQQIAKNKDIKVELLENIEYFISKPFSEKEINSIIWISVACENYEFLNNIFSVIELTKESEKFLFFTFDSFWGKAKFYECINKGFLKTKEHDNFEIHDRLKDFFIRSRNLKSCLVNIEDSEVVLNLAKESGSKLILELVEFILDYKSIN